MLNRNIFLWRSALGYTQKEMAKFLAISQQAYSRKEKGLVPFTDKEKIIIKEELREYYPDITIDDIFFSDNVLF